MLMKLSTRCMYGLNDLTYIYSLIFINGISSSLINLAMSLRAYDISNSASLVAITVMFYNMSYVIASWSLSKLTSKFRSIKNLLATIFAGYVLGVLLMIFNNLYLLFIGGVFIGISSALSSPMLMSILGSYVGKDSLTVARFNLVSTIASVIGYLIGSTSGSNILALEISAVISIPAILIANHIRVDSLIEIKKELHIPQIPITAGNIRSTPTTVQTHRLMYDFKILMYDLIKMFRKGVLRELSLLLIGSVALFTAISTFFSPFPAILKGRGFTDSDVFIMSLTSSIASIIWFRLASRFIKSISDAWSVLIKCVLSRIAIFSLPSLTLAFIDDLKILRLLITIFYILIGTTWALISTSLTTLILSLSEPERKGVRLGHMNGAIGAGTVLGSLCSAVIIQYGFLTNFAMVITLLMLTYLIFNKAVGALVT